MSPQYNYLQSIIYIFVDLSTILLFSYEISVLTINKYKFIIDV